MIELKHISKSYPLDNGSFHALHDINLTIHRGEIFGIFGESGAGKSTLIRTINLLEKPSHGQVCINDVDLTTLSTQSLKAQRRKMGMIFQHFQLLTSRTVFDNIALPLELIGASKADIKRDVTALLELVRLKEHAYHYPEQLSGGQQQRVAIARALATQPTILLCDEPTSALDTNSTASVLSLLKEVNQTLGVTIVLITHELDVIKRICTRAAVLDKGRLVEHGSVIQLFARPVSEVTRQLVQKALHMELPQLVKKGLQTQPAPDKSCLVRFMFVGDDSGQPLISTLVKTFNVTINILQANIETIQEVTVGFTVCLLSGNHQSIDQALAYVDGSSIKAEVLGYV